MKFIVKHDKTRTHLSRWALGGSLEIPSLFFWSSGMPEQRSQLGLLRSILFEILQKHKYLIPLAFADEWKSHLIVASYEILVTFNKWSLSRLKKAFECLIRNSPNI
jgi:hypothetical protein